MDNNLRKLNILAHCMSRCIKCELHKTRLNVVVGVGHYDPRLLLIGEAPGSEEDEQAEPFVGDSGVLLNIWIKYLRLKRTEYAICNIIGCHPPDNRDPKSDEIKICTDSWLRHQIQLLDPEIIIPLGRIASQYFLGDKFKTGITQYAGKFYKNNTIFPIPHPSFFIRHGNKGTETMWKKYLRPLKEYLENY